MKKRYSFFLFLVVLSSLVSISTFAQTNAKVITNTHTDHGITTVTKIATFPTVPSSAKPSGKVGRKATASFNALSQTTNTTVPLTCPADILLSNNRGQCGAVAQYSIHSCLNTPLIQTTDT